MFPIPRKCTRSPYSPLSSSRFPTNNIFFTISVYRRSTIILLFSLIYDCAVIELPVSYICISRSTTISAQHPTKQESRSEKPRAMFTWVKLYHGGGLLSHFSWAKWVKCYTFWNGLPSLAEQFSVGCLHHTDNIEKVKAFALCSFLAWAWQVFQ